MLQGGDEGGDEAAETEVAEGEGDGGEGPVGLEPGQSVQEMVEIVIAVQPLPRGFKIPADAVAKLPWPKDSLPEENNAFKETEEVVGKIARTDLFRGAPILRSQVVDDLKDVAADGSDAAAIIPPGTVAVALPLDLSGIGQVAYGIRDGDYIDVILSFLFIDVDETFQTRLPNNISTLTRLESGDLSIGAPRQGRQEPSTMSPEGVLVGPSENTQRPRLVVQRTIQNAFVVHVGYFPADGNFIGQTPTPMEVEAPPPPPGEGTEDQATTPAPSPTSYLPEIITLAVDPQEALVLVWAVDSQIPISLALRAAGDVSTAPTQAVSLQYMIQNFNVTQPDTLPFAIEPPITSVRRFDISTLYSFLAETFDTGE
ncbi:MAG: hypothetical protein JW966_09995 [Anaerolineae bacterium]|nr:hypothetical protein [Anaerolineae bacterium]